MKYRSALSFGEPHVIRIKGFTLIELIVVVIILMVLLGFTLVNYSSYNDKQKVKQAALTLKSDLHLARTNASSGKKPAVCDLDMLVGYNVTITSTMYTIVPECSALGEIVSEKKEVTLPLGISFSPLPSPTSFTYYPLTRGISDAPPSLTLTDGMSTITLKVDDTGASIITVTVTSIPLSTSTPTSTLTPTLTVTPTATLSPTPTETCVQQCSANFYGAVCEPLADCNAEVDGTSKGAGYDCVLPNTVCCCFFRK